MQGYTLDILLESQRFWADALFNEYSSIADYNISLVLFEFSKGTLAQHDNVLIAEGSAGVCPGAGGRSRGGASQGPGPSRAGQPGCPDALLPGRRRLYAGTAEGRQRGIAFSPEGQENLPALPTTPDAIPGQPPDVPGKLSNPRFGSNPVSPATPSVPTFGTPSPDRTPLPLPMDTGKNAYPPALTLPSIGGDGGGRF